MLWNQSAELVEHGLEMFQTSYVLTLYMLHATLVQWRILKFKNNKVDIVWFKDVNFCKFCKFCNFAKNLQILYSGKFSNIVLFVNFLNFANFVNYKIC